MYEDEFSNRLAELRTKKGVSARDMSLSLGQNSGYINHIENKQTLPSMTGFFNICEYFKITPQQFFEMDCSHPATITDIVCSLKCLNENQLHYLSMLVNDLALPAK